jgi:metallo-beta-lactamase class B
LLHNAAYPNIALDYKRTFRVLNALPCDIFLGAHGSYYDMEAKFAHLKQGQANPFIDADGYKSYVADREEAYRAELKKQSAANH